MSLAEAKTLAALAVPVTCQLLLDKFVQVTGSAVMQALSWKPPCMHQCMCTQIVAVVSVGRLGPAELAAASLGASLANVTGETVLCCHARALGDVLHVHRMVCRQQLSDCLLLGPVHAGWPGLWGTQLQGVATRYSCSRDMTSQPHRW